ncbi:MAG: DUF4399 domain-containing protein [Nitrospinales bacterium]
MKKLNIQLLVALSFMLSYHSVFAFDAVTITEPLNGASVSSPVTVCMETWGGLQVEPAKKGVNEGKGHHHLLIDTGLPSDLSKPVAKNATHIHMGDGSRCKTLNLSSGKHSIRSLFAQGNHVPYDPPYTDVIEVNVK